MSKRKSSIKSKKAQRVPYRVNPKRNMPRHTTKIKHKERILKAAREKEQVTYNGSPICLTVLQNRRERQVIFKVLKMKKSTTKITVYGKDLIHNLWRHKSFSDKQKLREFSTTKPPL